MEFNSEETKQKTDDNQKFFNLLTIMTSDSQKTKQQNISFSMEDFAKALEQHNYDFQKGQIVRGKTFEYTSDGAYIDIGGKSPAFIPLREASVEAIDNIKTALPLQEEKEFLIVSNQNDEGQVTLSIRQLKLKESWDDLATISEKNETVQMLVTGTNKGGVTGEVKGLRAFIPRSHLVEKENLDSLVGQILTGNILELNPDNNKLVLSQRQASQSALMQKIVANSVQTGTVVKLQPYGVFIDLGGITGLLHIKQISNSRIESLEQVFKVGQEIKVVIIDIDEIKNRISLATKMLESYPGELIEKFDLVMENAEERFEQLKSQQPEA